MIESNQNAQIKKILHLKKSAKFRNQSGSFIVEGWKMIAEAISAGLIKKIYVTYTEQGKLQETLLSLETQIDVEVITDKMFTQISDTTTPQGILAIVNMPKQEKLEDFLRSKSSRENLLGNKSSRENLLRSKSSRENLLRSKSSRENLLRSKSSLLCLEDINDPGNLGTMIRTAEGAGFSGVILSKGTVDIYNPKVVRATMGSIFRVPFLIVDDFIFTMDELKRMGFHLYATHLQGKELYNEVSYKGNIAILIGNEANGLSEQCTKLANTKLKIPMEGKLESLNASVCAGILMYKTREG